MTTYTKATEVHAYEGGAYHYTGDDGYPTAYLVPAVWVKDETGAEWCLPNSVEKVYDEDGSGPNIRARFDIYRAHEIANIVRVSGFRKEHWCAFESDNRTHEERAMDDLEFEHEQRCYGGAA